MNKEVRAEFFENLTDEELMEKWRRRERDKMSGRAAVARVEVAARAEAVAMARVEAAARAEAAAVARAEAAAVARAMAESQPQPLVEEKAMSGSFTSRAVAVPDLGWKVGTLDFKRKDEPVQHSRESLKSLNEQKQTFVPPLQGTTRSMLPSPTLIDLTQSPPPPSHRDASPPSLPGSIVLRPVKHPVIMFGSYHPSPSSSGTSGGKFNCKVLKLTSLTGS